MYVRIPNTIVLTIVDELTAQRVGTSGHLVKPTFISRVTI